MAAPVTMNLNHQIKFGFFFHLPKKLVWLFIISTQC